jgi:TolB-like protein
VATHRFARSSRIAGRALLAATPLLLPFARGVTQPAPTDDRRASVAISDFVISAMRDPADWAPLGKGMPQILMTELGANQDLRVVERERLQTVLDELKLSTSDLADPTTAARVGKLLGARYMVTGGVNVDRRNRIRLDVRGVRIETGLQEYADKLEGNADDVLALIARIGEKMSRNFDPTPFDAPSGRSSGSSGPTKEGLRLAMLIGNAVDLQDRKDIDGATKLVRQALAIAPDNPSAKALLASLQQGK